MTNIFNRKPLTPEEKEKRKKEKEEKRRKRCLDKDGNEISRIEKRIAGILLVLFTIVPVVLIVGLWPDRFSDNIDKQFYKLELFNIRLIEYNISTYPGNYIHINTILFLLVALAGFLGSMIHVASSFTNYIGAVKFKRRWLLWYIVKPFSAAGIALVFYLVLQAGLLNFGDGGKVNPYGIVIVSALAGLFADKAILKLEEIFLVMFKPKDDRPDKMKDDIKVTSVTPAAIEKGKENAFVISGEGLDKPAFKIFINDEPVANPEFTATAIKFNYTIPDTQKDKTEFVLVIKNEQNEVKYQQTLPLAEEAVG